MQDAELISRERNPFYFQNNIKLIIEDYEPKVLKETGHITLKKTKDVFSNNSTLTYILL